MQCGGNRFESGWVHIFSEGAGSSLDLDMEGKVILVDEQDKEIGTELKLKAHQDGKLHRAFSIFIFNSKGEMLLQKRSPGKYHSGGLWSNACCSHPEPGEMTESAAHRRLKEEMGFDCDLKEFFNFTYRAKLNGGLTENELDHVFVGNFDGEPKADPNEAEEVKWVNSEFLIRDIKRNPDKYTYWFRECCDRVVKLEKQRISSAII